MQLSDIAGLDQGGPIRDNGEGREAAYVGGHFTARSPLILGADLGSMPSGPTLAHPVVNTQGDADQTQSAQSTMQRAVAHSIPDQRNEPAVSVGEGMAPVPRKLAEKI